MATRTRIAAGIISILCFVGAGVVWCLQWQVEDVTGDVTVRDTGRFWSYPRYSILFPKIDASIAGHHSFDVAGLPPFPMTFLLELDGPPPNIGRLTVRIRDDKDRIVSEASDSASNWVWHRGSTSDLWHPNLRDLQFSRAQKYTIEIDIDKVDESTESQWFVPQLKGGGNELPVVGQFNLFRAAGRRGGH